MIQYNKREDASAQATDLYKLRLIRDNGEYSRQSHMTGKIEITTAQCKDTVLVTSLWGIDSPISHSPRAN